ncbi:MAG: hypothetical protein ABWX94_02855 [Candidatus Saccharimonadales bacterium]
MIEHSPVGPLGIESQSRHAHTRAVTLAAAEICLQGSDAQVDPNLFPVIPLHPVLADAETSGGVTVRIDTVGAFTAAFYAPSYGPSSQGAHFYKGMPLTKARDGWSKNVVGGYERSARPAAFNKLFFDKGLWQSFIDPTAPETADYRQRFEQADGDYRALKKDRGLLEYIESVRAGYFQRADLPHKASHTDAMRFANTVLHIDQRLQWTDASEEARTELLARNLPEMRRLAVWHATETNLATNFMTNIARPAMFLEKYLTVDSDRQKVGFDIETIQKDILRRRQRDEVYVRRGCPVLALKTTYQRETVSLFTAMDRTLLRMYQVTGALGDALLRPLPRPVL